MVIPLRPIGVGRGDRAAARVLGIVEDDLAAGRHFLEMDANDVGPFLQRGAGEVLLAGVQRADVDGDRAALSDSEMMRGRRPSSRSPD